MGPADVVKGVVDTWQREVFVSYFVEKAVVNTKTPGTSFLLDQESGRDPGTAAGFDGANLCQPLPSSVQQLLTWARWAGDEGEGRWGVHLQCRCQTRLVCVQLWSLATKMSMNRFSSALNRCLWSPVRPLQLRWYRSSTAYLVCCRVALC